jgi:4-amino-4-deoxy-L-arabinose transferase-like glycosyltransferase
MPVTGAFEERILAGLEDRRLQLLLVAALALVHAAAAWQFDLRSWDESLYAHRVLAVVSEGHWLDQTAFAVRGLWTSAHPPLWIWAMALSASVFGLSELSLRLPSLLASLATCVLLYRLATALTGTSRVGWLALAVYLAVPYITDLTRRAQLDGGVLFFMTLSIYLFCTPAPGRAPVSRALLSGVALGLGLLSKLAVAVLAPMSLAALLLWQHARGADDPWRAWRGWLVHASVAAAVALPWHAFMIHSHGAAYWDQAFGYHVLERTLRPLEGHASPLGVLYWPLEAIYHLGPLAPFAVLGLRSWMPAEPALRRVALCWLAVPALAVCLVATRNDTYFLMFVLPVVFFAAVGLQLLLERRIPPRRAAATAAFVLVALCWKLVEPLRQAVEALAGEVRAAALPGAPGLLAVAGLIALSLALLALARGRHGRALVVSALGAVVLSPIHGCARLVRPETPEWHGVRRALDAQHTGRTLDLAGDASHKAHFYQRAIAFDAGRGERRDSTPDCVVTEDEARAASLAVRYPQRQEHGDLVLLCSARGE